jgi:O-antigen ligase
VNQAEAVRERPWSKNPVIVILIVLVSGAVVGLTAGAAGPLACILPLLYFGLFLWHRWELLWYLCMFFMILPGCELAGQPFYKLFEILFMVFFFLWLGFNRLRGMSGKLGFVIMPLLAWIFVSIMWAEELAEWGMEFNLFFMRFLLFFLTVNYIREDYGKLKWTLVVITISSIFASVYYWIQCLTGAINPEDEKLHGAALIFFDPNYGNIATCLGLALCLHAGWWIKERWLKITMWILVPLACLGIITSNSKGGMAGMVIVMVAFAIINWKNKTIRNIMTTIIVLAAVGMPISYQQRMKATAKDASEAGLVDPSAKLHADLAKFGIEMFKQNWLTGSGFGQFSGYVRYIDTFGVVPGRFVAHHLYIQTAAELGLPGIILLMLIFVVAWIVMMRATKLAKEHGREDLRRIGHSLMMGFGCFLLSSNTVSSLHFAYLWIMLGLMVAHQKVTREEAFAEEPHEAAPPVEAPEAEAEETGEKAPAPAPA